MRNVKITSLVGKGVNRTILILFKPFSVKKWLCLLFIASLAGAMGGGNVSFKGGGRGRVEAPEVSIQQIMPAGSIQQFLPSRKTQSAVGVTTSGEVIVMGEEKAQPAIGVTTSGEVVVMGQWDEALPAEAAETPVAEKSFWDKIPRGFIRGIGIIGVLVTLLAVLFMWLGARFKFIWFRSIVGNDASIKLPFVEFAAEGNSLFVFLLVFSCVTLAYIGLLGFWAYSSLVSAGAFQQGFEWSFARVLGLVGPPLLLGVTGATALLVLYVFVDHFVVTIMGVDRCPFMTGWRKFADILRQNKKDLTLYLLVLIGLGIVSGAAQVALAIVVLLGLLLAGAVIFGIPYLVLVALFKANVLFTILAVIAGIPFLIVLLLAVLATGLPFAVFFRSFSLYFLSSLNAGYMILPLEETAQDASPE